MIILDIVDCCLIVCAPTGVSYTNQVGGHACAHPQVEGYVIRIWQQEIYEFNDCSYGCYNIYNDMVEDEYNPKESIEYSRKAKENLTRDINNILHEKFNNNKNSYGEACIHTLLIDEDRINEMREAWWPVKGTLYYKGAPPKGWYGTDDGAEEHIVEIKGYITKHNCD